MSENWRVITRAEAARFIAEIQTPDLPGVFDLLYLRVQEIGVPFLKNGFLRLVENLKTAPPFTLDYIQCGNQVYYMDGGPEVFTEIAQHPNFTLNASTALCYLRYFCSYVIQQPENVMVFQGVEFMPFTDTVHLDFQFDKQNLSEDDITVNESQDGGFTVQGPFIFSGKIDPGTAHIKPNGQVTIMKGHTS